MSAPTTSLPADIVQLMGPPGVNGPGNGAGTPVSYEKLTKFDQYGQSLYAAAVTLYGWVEPYGISGGTEAFRNAQGTILIPAFELYFDGDSAVAQGFTLYDRFSLPATPAAIGLKLEPVKVGVYQGPGFDNANPWIINVILGRSAG